MRFSVLSTFAVLTISAVACDGEPLTGPDAQAAYSQAVSHYPTVPGTAVVFVDDQRMPVGTRLDQLDPKDIVRVELLKGDAAARLYGNGARQGVIRVYTVHAARPTSSGAR